MKYKGYTITKFPFFGYVIRDKDGIAQGGRNTIAKVKKLIDKLVSGKL